VSLGPERPAFTGAVLTGGGSTRMGVDKALLEVSGRPLAAYGRDALRAAGADRVLAVGGDTAALTRLGFEVVPDLHPGAGPLGGVLTALASSTGAVVVVLACDQPDVDGTVVGRLVDALDASHCDVSTARDPQRRQPLPVALRRATHAAISSMFDSGERSLVGALGGLHVCDVDIDSATLLADLDEPADVRRYAAGEDLP
jgi:molybdopterin-guanine dinucleotide biosynthesis protein A